MTQAKGHFITYCVSERPALLQRLFANIATWAVQPLAVLVVTPVKKSGSMTIDEHNEWSRVITLGNTLLENYGISVEYLPCSENDGIPRRKNIALQWVKVLGDDGYLYDPKFRPYMLSVDDDFVLEPFATHQLCAVLSNVHYGAQAVGPLMRQINNTAIVNNVSFDKRVGYVKDSVWHWGAFIQGQFWTEHITLLQQTQGLAGVYMHKYEYGREKFYDTDFIGPNYFMHETDYVAGSQNFTEPDFRKNYIITSAVAHHWPPATGNLTTYTNFKRSSDTFHNIRLFATKRNMGKVEKVDWSNFREDYTSVFGRDYRP